jgi:putative phage-type endonuclease
MQEIDRKTYIGGSDIAAILGISKYKTPYEVWELKLGLTEPDQENDAMKWGKILEKVILDEVEVQEKVKIIHRNDVFMHKDYPFLGNHPDGLDSNFKINDECKTVATWAYKGWEDPVPFEYYCQIQHEMDCIRCTYPQLDRTRFIVFEMDSRKLHIEYISYDPEFAEKQREFLIKFWTINVQQNIPPDYQVSDFARSNNIMDTYREVDTEMVEKIKQRNVLANQLKNIEKDLEETDNWLKLQIGLNEGLRNGIEVLATWKSQSRSYTDTKILKDKYPDVYKEVLKETKFRVLRIKS